MVSIYNDEATVIKIAIINPLDMQWVGNYKRCLPEAVWFKKWDNSFVPDVMVHMWCNPETAIDVSNTNCRHIVFVRRYEWYAGYWKQVDWSKVEAVILVNDFLAAEFERYTKIKPHVIYNGVNVDRWKFRERSHGKNIALVGFINQKKNIPLALQILAKLPEDYCLHIAGDVQDYATLDYMDNIAKATKRRVFWNGNIPHSDMNIWLEDKNYILSTAISEGCPNNVIEAMAKGIKPIVHNWCGAKQQFGKYCFNTVDEAIGMIDKGSDYSSKDYRQLVEDYFGLDNYEQVKEIILGHSNWIRRDRQASL